MINAYLKYLLHEKRYSKHTVKSYENDLTQFSAFLTQFDNSISIEHAKHRMMRSWIVSLIDDKLSPRSVNRKIATLRSFYKFLHAREIISENPSIKLSPLKTDKPLPEFIQESQMHSLFDRHFFNEDFEGQRDQLIISLLYGTGIRLSELIGLTDQSVNLYDQTIKVLGKRNKERIIPLPNEIVQHIKTYSAKRNEVFGSLRDNYLLVTSSGKKCYPMMVYRVVKKHLTDIARSSKRSPHVLRHTFATHLLNKGADLNAVKDLLGHSSLAATQVYTHNSLDKLKTVFDQAHPKA